MRPHIAGEAATQSALFNLLEPWHEPLHALCTAAHSYPFVVCLLTLIRVDSALC